MSIRIAFFLLNILAIIAYALISLKPLYELDSFNVSRNKLQFDT